MCEGYCGVRRPRARGIEMRVSCGTGRGGVAMAGASEPRAGRGGRGTGTGVGLWSVEARSEWRLRARVRSREPTVIRGVGELYLRCGCRAACGVAAAVRTVGPKFVPTLAALPSPLGPGWPLPALRPPRPPRIHRTRRSTCPRRRPAVPRRNKHEAAAHRSSSPVAHSPSASNHGDAEGHRQPYVGGRRSSPPP